MMFGFYCYNFSVYIFILSFPKAIHYSFTYFMSILRNGLRALQTLIFLANLNTFGDRMI